MVRRLTLSTLCLVLITACAPDVDLDDAADEADTTDDEQGGTGDETGGGDGDGDEVGDGDGPANFPTPTGTCPSFATGNVTMAPAGIDSRLVKVWVDPQAPSGGALVIYWHAYTSAPDEAVFGLSQAVIDEITSQGGMVVAPYAASDVGTFPWFVVNQSPRQDDMILADELVACAVEQLDVDRNRIHSMGMSAGGLQTVAFAMARSRYIASVTTYSGGAAGMPAFEDPSNRFAAMIVHGGDNDTFGGSVNFKTLSIAWFNQLIGNGNFAFLCDHGGAHTLPVGMGDDVWEFFQDHPFGTEPSPYESGLPSTFPSSCAL